MLLSGTKLEPGSAPLQEKEVNIQAKLDQLLKPVGSLGRLERLASDLGRIQQTDKPRTRPRSLYLFTGDHGVVSEGVTQWPASVTTAMLEVARQGKAASSVFAHTFSVGFHIIDVGSLNPTTTDHHVRKGTRNLLVEPALTVDEFQQAFSIGEKLASDAARSGVEILIAGEMGIGNTTAAACVTALLTGQPAEACVGTGAGANETILNNKRRVVREAVSRAQTIPDLTTRLASISGLEIAAMAGFYVGGGKAGKVILLDGFIATSAALIAESLHPGTRNNLIAAHLSAEPGHNLALKQLELQPYLDNWQLRLGEGTGALLLVPLLDAAAAILNGMGTFADLGM